MIGHGAPPCGQFDNTGRRAFFNRQKGVRCQRILSLQDARKRHDGAALKENRQLLLERAHKTLLGRHTDLIQGVRGGNFLPYNILTLDGLHRNLGVLAANRRRLFQLQAAMLNAAFDHLQFLDLAVNDGQLLAQNHHGGVKGVFL